MAENTNSTSVDGSWHSNSPLPYLFVGLALVLGVIAVALIMLACSPEEPPADSNSATDNDDDDGKNKVRKPVYADPETAPRIVVMAGDDKPRYLANPTASTFHTHELV